MQVWKTANVWKLAYASLPVLQAIMGSDRTRDTLPDGVQRSRTSHGRTSGPTRRSTKGQWTAEEDEILCMAVQRFEGKNWKKIAECFKDRTDVQCLHRWQKVLNPELVKGPWSKEEDEIIVELVAKYGPKKWSTIAQHLPGRIGKQCRERWHNHLNPGINKEAWTQDEELTLIRAHQIYGNKWAELTKFLPGRSDNAIKNHWNSSVKKKLDMYLASGLLSQFEGPPVISQSNHSVASSSSKAQQSSEDDRNGPEVEEASECSQGAINKAEESTPIIPCSDELGDKFLEHVLSLDWSTFAGKDWKLNTNELPDTSLLDLGQESTGQQFMPSLNNNNDTITFPTNTCNIELGASTSMVNTFVCSDDSPNLVANPDCEMVHAEDSPYQMPYAMSDDQLIFGVNPDQYNCFSQVNNAEQESILPTTHDGFIYIQESDCFPCEDNSAEAKPSPKQVLADDFRCCSSKDRNSVESDDQKDSGALFYEPPRFPSLDVPFFSCDLVQSGGDMMHQEFSPLGIRQLMISSSMTPFKLWDSPSRDDNSPVAVLKSAAKSFTGTPSIVKKRRRDLLSPLSEKRGEKKLDVISEESISDLRNDISRLEAMFNECVDQKGAVLLLSPNSKGNLEVHCTEKENVASACKQAKNEGNEGVFISERIISQKEFNVSECLETIKEQTDNNPMDKAKEFSGILVEHDMNDLLFFSPDRFGVKGDRSSGVSARALFSPSETSCFSVVCSPRFRTKKDGTNDLVITSLQSMSPSEKKVESFGKGLSFGNSSIYMETPFKRSIESPSPWKSPWFMNNFVPGPKVDTDITIEDMGYYLSPGDRGYDAIGLMKQLGEQTAGAFADAQEILGNETPETLLKGK
ncbi:myb-related protein 3r-1 [Phtheirospermum japonicum]|uniref:Myb-related protein 3r-1 n=1 Tax=Phtheirospermum japonicum TaxID=374723 RepID=A0A830B4L8_9LAMI|nr:myb-related protein 3r-1 [Phtheirospermum japonicum]